MCAADVVLDMAGYKKPPSSSPSSRSASPSRNALSEQDEERRRGVKARRSREASLEVVEDGKRRLSAGKGWNDDGGELASSFLRFQSSKLVR